MTGALRIDKTIMVAGINPSTGGNELLSVTTYDPPAERIDGIYMLAGIAPDGTNVLLRLNSDGTLGSSSGGGGSLPVGGTTGQFLRGDETWNNVLEGHSAFGVGSAVDPDYFGFGSTFMVTNVHEVITDPLVGTAFGFASLIEHDLSADAETYVYGMEATVSIPLGNTKNYTGELYGIAGGVHADGSGTLVGMYGATIFTSVSQGHVGYAIGVGAEISMSTGGIIDTAYGVKSNIRINSNAIITAAALFYGAATVEQDTSAIETLYGLYVDEQTEAVNNYFLWYDSPGVYRVKGDGVMAYYNPTFTKYVPGAANFERVVQQWNTNVLEYGTEVGAGGGNVLRPVRLIGASVQVMGLFAANGATPAARPDYTVTNVVTDRTYDANATTTDELADVLGTLIADLTAIGLLQ